MTEKVAFNVKWGKEALKVDFVIASGVKGLKTELEEKTNVPADRMKIMAKSKGLWKGVLKDDFDLSSVDFASALSKAGGKELQVLLMGSAGKLAAPKTKTVFVEDLPPEEVAKVVEPSGLENLGNTCYLNSVVQCLRAVPELRQGLVHYSPPLESPNSLQIRSTRIFLSALRDTFAGMDRTASAVQPGALVSATKTAFPQFAQRGPHGQPMQQDAEEFYSGLLTMAASEMTSKESLSSAFGHPLTEQELKGADNLIDAVFGLKMEETLTCDEFDNPDQMDVDGSATEEGGETKKEDNNMLTEPKKVSYDLLRKLVCNIQGGSDGASTANVTFVDEGIALSLNGKIEKNSEVLGRNAIWTRKQRIARLPPILVVQFGRFYWKATPDSQDHAGVKCKVMKPVAFNGVLDIYQFCSEAVQKVLKVSRDKAAKLREEETEAKLKGNNMLKKSEEEDVKMKESETATEGKEEEKGAGTDEMDDLQKALALSMEETLPPVGPGLPENFQGLYELFAVVTHKGRDADGGHYMAWVKAASQQNNVAKIADTEEMNEDWFVFDDDEVSPCKTEDVLKLKGGGDWHMSYLNLYRAKK